MHPVRAPPGPLPAAAGGGPYTAGLVTKRPALGCLFEIVETLVLTLIIFVVIQNFVAQPYKVQQQSMERTLEPEQYVLVDKLTPRFDTYKRGDIVVFTPPEDWGDNGTPFIKRVIGEAATRSRSATTGSSTSTTSRSTSRTSTPTRRAARHSRPPRRSSRPSGRSARTRSS